jgi:uncharacterized protein
MASKWLFFLALIAFFWIAACLAYPRLENYLVFFPVSRMSAGPKDLHLSHQDVSFSAQDGTRLHGWLFPLPGEAPVVVYFHGNAENISHCLDFAQTLLAQGIEVFLVDYRGYGKSEGTPSEQGIYLDGDAAYRYLAEEKKYAPERIVLFGRSLGGAVAIEVSLRRRVRAVIIESAFTSTRDMAKTMFPFCLFFPLLPVHYDSIGKIAAVSVPKLFIHSENDEIVPFAMGRALFEAAPQPKYFFPLKGAGHNDTSLVGGEKYFRAIADFVRDLRL